MALLIMRYSLKDKKHFEISYKKETPFIILVVWELRLLEDNRYIFETFGIFGNLDLGLSLNIKGIHIHNNGEAEALI